MLLHAICDALLGAAGLGDIGQHYPDTDPAFSEIDSRKLLRDVAQKLAGLKLKVVNIDATIVAEAPRMAPHVKRMIGNIAADLGIDARRRSTSRPPPPSASASSAAAKASPPWRWRCVD